MNTEFLYAIKNINLAHDLRQIADDFEILDFFKILGSSCFAMSAVLADILKEKGYATRVQGCYAEIKQSNTVFYLGYKGFAHERQREGHAVCIVNEQYLVDFGLGTLRKFYSEDFSKALACEVTGDEAVLASLSLDHGVNMQWRKDWISPHVEDELLAQAESVDMVLADYRDFQKNRMPYLIKKLFVSKNNQPTNTSSSVFIPEQAARRTRPEKEYAFHE
ncbi:hypothetical protein [Undibacterium sp. TJN19]|uniref:hypothetical protein n=1 Tax=Undibacterium sp. TJN19 TaxID=3413055 RepID=UPI003BF0CBAC